MKEIFGLQFLEETEATEGELMACAVFGGALQIGYCYQHTPSYTPNTTCDDNDDNVTVIYDGSDV